MHKALFLDRDGIINQDTGYPYKPEHILFIEDVFSLCSTAQARGYLLIVVTNQAGVAKGLFSERDVCSLHQWIKNQFFNRGIKIDAFYYCPFHPHAADERYRSKSVYRKPGPGLIQLAVQEWSIDCSRSLMVGDKESDRIQLPDLKSIIVKSKYTDTSYDVETYQEVESLLR